MTDRSTSPSEAEVAAISKPAFAGDKSGPGEKDRPTTERPRTESGVEQPSQATGDGRSAGRRALVAEPMLLFPSWLTSAAFHLVVLLVLALLVIPPEQTRKRSLVATTVDSDEALDDAEALRLDVPDQQQQPTEVVDLSRETPIDSPLDLTEFDEGADSPIDITVSEIGIESLPNSDLLSEIVSFSGGSDLQGRAASRRGELAAAGGGSPESELAVSRALAWFAKHQNPDGSWNFNHERGPCQGRCENPGNLDVCTTGATGMALLPFLGAGQTHLDGEYKQVVSDGIYYLVRRLRLTESGGSFVEGGGLYDHGIATIALCEAFAMTQDAALKKPSQRAIDFIVAAQDPIGGGWRYEPRQPGDTSVVGWQLMALKSGHMGYLKIPSETIQRAGNFLDFVGGDGGSYYGYARRRNRYDPKEFAGTTAVGLLCRMYLGWDRDHSALKKGVAALGRKGPSPSNMYYNYYATQVMHHFGGDEWKRWNARMRDYLVQAQAKAGHEAGSWHFFAANSGEADKGASAGGRLYFTSLACMTLEVYYRYLPLYTKQSTMDEFE